MEQVLTDSKQKDEVRQWLNGNVIFGKETALTLNDFKKNATSYIQNVPLAMYLCSQHIWKLESFCSEESLEILTKRNPKLQEEMWLQFLSILKIDIEDREATTVFAYSTVEEFQNKYNDDNFDFKADCKQFKHKEFKKKTKAKYEQDIDKFVGNYLPSPELTLLWLFGNWTAFLKHRCDVPKQYKGLALAVIPKLCNDAKEYKTGGGGVSNETADRAYIYSIESGNRKVSRPDRVLKAEDNGIGISDSINYGYEGR
jgi:predicted nucleic acid-binding Zn ribbon protein